MDSTNALLRGRINLGFSLNIIVFIVNFEHLELRLFAFHIFHFFSLGINIPTIHNNIIEIASFQTVLNVFLTQLASILRGKS